MEMRSSKYGFVIMPPDCQNKRKYVQSFAPVRMAACGDIYRLAHTWIFAPSVCLNKDASMTCTRAKRPLHAEAGVPIDGHMQDSVLPEDVMDA